MSSSVPRTILIIAFLLVGGYRFHQQEFQPMAAQLNSSLMTVAVIAVIVPAAFHEFLGDRLGQDEEGPILLRLSRGSAVVLMLMCAHLISRGACRLLIVYLAISPM
jgi:Ca2+:H+ antiporter